MKLILEGPDNAGKTTLAQKLVNAQCSVHYRHAGGKPNGLREETDCCINQIAQLNLEGVLLDRITPISQQVYNPDPGLQLTRNKYLAEIRFKNPVFIYCRPSNDRLMRTEAFTWREGESEEHKQKIIQNQHTFIERYDQIMARIPHVAYDFEDPTSTVIFNQLVKAFRGDKAAEKWFTDLMDFRSI